MSRETLFSILRDAHAPGKYCIPLTHASPVAPVVYAIILRIEIRGNAETSTRHVTLVFDRKVTRSFYARSYASFKRHSLAKLITVHVLLLNVSLISL